MRGNYNKFFINQPCNFIAGATKPESFPNHELAEVAFIGRSNVGKSSLLNALMGRKAIAKVSNTPGRTKQINFFCLGDKLLIVDLPGYGYAKLSHKERNELGRLINLYLLEEMRNKYIYILIDMRHKPFAIDIEMLEQLQQYNLPYHVILTKADKLKASEKEKQLEGILQLLPNGITYTICSAKTGEGIGSLRENIYGKIGS